jgi:ethanolamine utilization protein EutN
MVLGRVVGKAISTVKHRSLQSMRLVLVEPIQAASNDPVLALDQLGSGPGDVVVMSSDGIYTREVVNDNTSPARWTIICIADDGTKVMDQLVWVDR